MNKALYVFITLLFCGLELNAQSKRKPNVVFIVADDLGYGDIEPYGQRLIQTPNLDRLAREGMKYTNFYAGTSVCAPSRSSLMTGQHTGHTPIRGNKEIQPEGQFPLPAEATTIGKIMKKAGYATGLFGKWGLGFVGSEGDPIRQGFDQFYGYNCQAEAHRYYPTHLWNNNTKVDLKDNHQLQNPVAYAPDLIQQKALQFIEQNSNKPFLLFLTYTLPHAELLVPDDSLFLKYKGTFPEKPYKGNDYGDSANRMGYASQPYPHAAFAAMVSRLDMYVGQVMNKLKMLGIENNTLVMFTSDNGPHWEGGADPAFFNSSGGLRGTKRDLYEGGIRVPFIVRWPGQVKPGKVNNHIAAFWDILPTLAEVAKVPVEASIDGISLLPSMKGKKQEVHDHLYWEFHENGGQQAVRMGTWKGVRQNVRSDSAATLELYDLNVDPFETKNVATNYGGIVRQMELIMQNEHVENKDFPLTNRTAVFKKTLVRPLVKVEAFNY